MKILQISTKDIGGGAEKIAYDLFSAYRARGYDSWLAVGFQRGNNRNVIPFPEHTPPASVSALIRFRDWLRQQNQRIPGAWRVSNVVDWIARPQTCWDRHWGIEDFNYPNSRRLLDFIPETPGIIHAHNLHGGYFDLRYLVELSRRFPLALTLHDEWNYTGHCAYTLGCDRWQHGCGSCPDLAIYPAIRRDATAYNWKRKQRIYRESTLYITTPSQWLMDQVERSMLNPVEGHVIHNGVNLKTFRSGERSKARCELDLPSKANIVLAAANWNRVKDYTTIQNAVRMLATSDRFFDKQIIFVALGGHQNETTNVGKVQWRNIPFITEPSKVAQYFRAADVFLHAAHSDNFPTTILESLACGTLVIATTVGGVPEQIQEGVTGFLVPPGDSEAMAARLAQLLRDDDLRQKMGAQAAETARRDFSLERMVDDYLDWYQEIISMFKRPNE